MPIYEYLCVDCGKMSEILVTRSGEIPLCQFCKSANLSKMLSTSSSLSGSAGSTVPAQETLPVVVRTPDMPAVPVPAAAAGKRTEEFGRHHTYF